MTHLIPRVWIGSLGCYNAGHLTGDWTALDGRDESEITEAARQAIRERLPAGISEAEALDELWCFDLEGLSPLITAECGISEAVHAAELLAAVDEDQRDAFRAWAENIGAEHADPADFADAYAGEHDSIETYAQELIDECGLLDGAPETLARYFDLSAYARDLELGGDYFTMPTGRGTVHVFRNV